MSQTKKTAPNNSAGLVGKDAEEEEEEEDGILLPLESRDHVAEVKHVKLKTRGEVLLWSAKTQLLTEPYAGEPGIVGLRAWQPDTSNSGQPQTLPLHDEGKHEEREHRGGKSGATAKRDDKGLEKDG